MSHIEPVIPDLKLSQVTLFKVGIGSFQKKGTIELSKTKSLKLTFKNTVMNDLLKTFSILRVSGDLMIKGVSYEAKDTNKSKLLEDSFINLPEQNAMTALFKQIRGVAVRLRLFDKTLEGKVLGLQNYMESPTGKVMIPQEYVILAYDEGAVHPVRIADIQGIEILDSAVEKDFQFFLETIVGGNKEKNRSITLFLEGTEPSEFILNFLQEVPAWKTSYRLFVTLPESDAAKSEASIGKISKSKVSKTTKSKMSIPMEDDLKSEVIKEEKRSQAQEFKRSLQIQGWAIIDNVLDEDWENVDLTLVTGLPISFIYDSYSPAWIVRPSIERKSMASGKVVQFDRSREPLKKAKAVYREAVGGMSYAAAPAPPPGAKPMAQPMAKMDRGIELADMDIEKEEFAPEPKPEVAFEAASEAEKSKGLSFKYHIKTPVNVKRNNSSLIPILQSGLDGLQVSVYNQTVNAKHPMLTIEFKNSSGFTLEEGPLSIFIEGVFAGEAILPFLEPNGDCRIPYAVDQGIEVHSEIEKHSLDYHAIEVDREIYKKYFEIREIKYDINNFSEESRQIILEHPRQSDVELFETESPKENTPQFYRFIFIIEKKSKIAFTIKERRILSSYEESTALTKELIKKWLDTKLISKEEYEYLRKRLEMTQELAQIQDEMEKMDEKINLIFEEQTRLRENLQSLRQSTSEMQLRERYIAKFDERETELENIEKTKSDLQVKLTAQTLAVQKLETDWLKQQIAIRKTKQEGMVNK